MPTNVVDLKQHALVRARLFRVIDELVELLRVNVFPFTSSLSVRLLRAPCFPGGVSYVARERLGSRVLTAFDTLS